MTPRARLTVALLTIVVGPLVIGGAFVITAAGSVDRSGDRERLDLAASALRTTIGAACDRLLAAAESAATATAAGTQATAARSIVDAGRASAVRFEGADGVATLVTPDAPGGPWVMCAPVAGAARMPSTGTAPGALTAGAPIRDVTGRVTGYAYAAQALDVAYVHRLASDVGTEVTVVGNQPVRTVDNAYVRTVAPIAGQPFELAVSVPRRTQTELIFVVIGVIVLAGSAAIGGGRTLVRATLRPAADDARVPDRLARRDQVRGNLDVLGAALSSSHDQPGILRVILASALAETGASRGVVVMTTATEATTRADATTDGSGDIARVSLTVQCSEGFDDGAAAGLTSLAVAPGAGMLGAVAATGVARSGRVADPTTELDSDEPRCATYLAVPLGVPRPDAAATPGPAATDVMSGGIGVLALYDRIGGGDFDAADLHTVSTFAQHAAVAIDNVRRHEEAQRLSHTDSLTGLYNYRHLQDTIGREINRSARFGHSMCVLVLDLDRFKDVNDTYGHAAGDAVLAEFARRISDVIRGVDLAFRIGGEEFVLLLPETVAAGGEVLAKRVGSAIRDHPITVPDAFRATADLMTVEMPLVTRVGFDGAYDGGAGNSRAPAAAPPRYVAHIPITVSIGVAVFPDHGTIASDVLEAADAALYAAKSAGRNTYRIAVAPVRAASATPPLASAARASAGDPAPPTQRSDQDALINAAERPDAADVEVDAADRAGGASTTGPPPRESIGR